MTRIERPTSLVRCIVMLLSVIALLGMVACGGDDDGPTSVSEQLGEESSSDEPSPSEEPSPSDAPTSPSAGGGHPACEPAQRISDLDDEVTTTLTEELTKLLSGAATGEAPTDAQFDAFLLEVQRIVDEKVPELVNAYDDLAATVPSKLTEDAETLRDFTVDFTTQLAQLTPEELQNIDKLLQGPEALEAAGATFALDSFTQKECGIVLAD